jgi:hypothetical protein
VVLESGALVLWSRQGAVVANHGDSQAVMVRGLLDALDEFVAIRREAHALATRASLPAAERLSTGRKLIERVARLKLTADGPNGLSLGRLMRDSSFEDVLVSLRTAAEFDHAEQTRRADDRLQIVLGIGLTVGLLFSFLQIWPEVTESLHIETLTRFWFWVGLILSVLPGLFVLLNRKGR